jgi:hypothetical protein
MIEAPLAAASPGAITVEPTPEGAETGPVATWELETSATGDALLLDAPLL